MSLKAKANSDRRSPHYLWQLRPYMRQVAGQLVLGSLAGIVMNTTVVLPALLLGRAIDTVTAYTRGRASIHAVAHAAVLLIIGTIITEGPRIGKRWWLMTANGRMRASIRADALRGVLGWPMDRLHSTPVGDLMAKIIGDVEVLGVGLREFTTETWDTVLFSASLVVAMCRIDLRLAAWSLLPVPVAIVVAKLSGVWISHRTTRAREANSALTVALQEQLSGVRVLRLFGQVGVAVERVAGLSKKFADANLAAIRLKGGLVSTYTTLMGAGLIFLIWFGSRRVISSAMTVGTFMAFYELFMRFTGRAFRIPQMMNTIQSGGAAFIRLKPLLAPPLGMRKEPGFASFKAYHLVGPDRVVTEFPPVSQGPVAVSFDDITFTYPGSGAPALIDFKLDVPAGSMVAVTGPVGSGKSALARALLGLYPLDSGRITLDGKSLESISASERAARVGYLPQDPYLLSGSIAENILMGEPDPEPEVAEAFVTAAVERAALAEDVKGFSDGLETQIGESGVRVSGGQRLRIALARALVSSCPLNPGLLILDDPFSAVDVETEARIIRALHEAFGPDAPPEKRTTIVLCSHRLAAFPLADQVVVLDGGRMVERGTHDKLMAAGNLYSRIYTAQCKITGDLSREEEAL